MTRAPAEIARSPHDHLHIKQIRSLARGLPDQRPSTCGASSACAAVPHALFEGRLDIERVMRPEIQAVGRRVTDVKLPVRLAVRMLSVPVRDVRRPGHVSARTYGGQGKLFTWAIWEFEQLSGHSGQWRETVCKTVGSAYVGLNPTPATTSGSGP